MLQLLSPDEGLVIHPFNLFCCPIPTSWAPVLRNNFASYEVLCFSRVGAVCVAEDYKRKGQQRIETDKLEPAKCFIKEVNNNKEDKVPNCALNVTIFEDQSLKNVHMSLKR